MKKKVLGLGVMAILSGIFMAGCSGNKNQSKTNSDKVEISMLIGKEEIANELDAALEEYNNSQDKYEVKIIPLAGQNATEKLTSLYASKNAPILINTGVYTELAQWEDKFLDLSDMDLVEHIDQKYLEAGTVNGKVIGIPTTIEAFGYLYNQEVLDDAVGGTFDPDSIQSRDDLKVLMEKIAALDGKKAIEVSPMDWSLGAHYTNLLFTNQSADAAERKNFMTDIQAGTTKLTDNEVFQGWVDTFDLMKEYNSAEKSPLSADYDSATLGLANGDIGLWFMGNWAYPQLREANPDAKIGILPVPISDEKDAYGNTQISIGVPQTWGIDAAQSTKEQQEGAKDFLTWLYEDEVGQDHYVNKMGFIPINDNAKAEPKDELSKQVLAYLQEDRGLEWMNAHYPPTAFPAMGASLQKYLGNQIDRDELATEFETYWEKSGE
ncbi:raffinose/stachyose/melibiose transport system substrate-binding protein [Enterococcus sp. PF1-24]|uniref:ABC transporter substrate-binding protein n=1 Tax=unclassified Enterococcus TaxID=2608891 RepID=UPI00247431C4|nr:MULTISPECIES: ABC transporter substrate-binding protein [unclassified Enterococcus]MDH6363786.1 raffinose/stachyose/melibiose transport system substrate-binding protein [Enterococcus sp. PFB1-1]MDH6400742.1 raffinose/stachyose/melibiose transport system substrate-binding protein [Enterococcus sp. PF1-24]